MGEFTIGQKLWYVPHDKRAKETGEREVTVLKVGRKWITTEEKHQWGVSEQRFDRTTLNLDCGGYSSRGRAYLSQEAWHLQRDRDDAWAALKSAMRNSPHKAPDHLTTEQIVELRLLLTGEPR